MAAGGVPRSRRRGRRKERTRTATRARSAKELTVRPTAMYTHTYARARAQHPPTLPQHPHPSFSPARWKRSMLNQVLGRRRRRRAMMMMRRRKRRWWRRRGEVRGGKQPRRVARVRKASALRPRRRSSRPSLPPRCAVRTTRYVRVLGSVSLELASTPNSPPPFTRRQEWLVQWLW